MAAKDLRQLFAVFDLNMALKAVPLAEALTTRGTIVGFFSCVPSHVERQSLCLGEGALAHLTGVGPFTSMDIEVLLEGTVLSEALTASGTGVGFGAVCKKSE